MIHEDAAHRFRGGSEEVAPVLPGGAGREAEVSLVDERGGLQGVARRLAPQVRSSDAAQFRIYRLEEAVIGLRSPEPAAFSRCVRSP